VAEIHLDRAATFDGTAVAIRREMTTFNAHSIVRMEGKVNAVVQKALDSQLAVTPHSQADVI